MGIYDRDYSRGPEPGFHVSAPRTATIQLVLINVAVYVAQLAYPAVSSTLALSSDWYLQPWTFYQLLTYGFLHSTAGIEHILINMLVLWMFGQEIERRYGRSEFLSLYLSAIVFSGLVWSLIEAYFGNRANLVGASGGISAIFALFALNFPHRRVLFMFIIPMPMWVAALIALGFDAKGAMDRSGNVAFTGHLAGALFGLFYFRYGWPLGRWLSGAAAGLPRPGRPKLRVHAPDEPGEPEEDDLSQKVDAILQKIQQQGQGSLTWNERRLLEKASLRYQDKRK